LYVEKHGESSLKAAKIRILTPLKSNFYFQFAPQTIGRELTTLKSHMQNSVEIDKEWQM